MPSKPLSRPRGPLYLLWWFLLTVGAVTVIFGVQLIFFPAADSLAADNPIWYTIFSLFLAPCLGGMMGAYALIPAGVHALLRGFQSRLLQTDEESGLELYGWYRLFNFGYGFVVGFLMAGIIVLFEPDPENSWKWLGGSGIVFGIISFLVGELVRPKFFEPPKPTSPSSPPTRDLPKPFPKRELSDAESNLLDDADEVVARLANTDPSVRRTTLFTLAQLAEPTPYVLDAVNLCAAYDSNAYVRYTAYSVLIGWNQPVPPFQPDPSFDVTAARIRALLAPDVPARGADTQMEYSDYVFTWQPQQYVLDGPLELDAARGFVWAEFGTAIQSDLQTYQDRGWETDMPVGPNAIEIKSYGKFNWLLLIFGGFFLLVLSAILSRFNADLGGLNGLPSVRQLFHEPKELRLPMHRKKSE